MKKKNSIAISVFGYKNKEKYPINISKKCYEKKLTDLLLIGEEAKHTMFSSMSLIHLCMIKHYIMEENFSVVIVYNFSVRRKYFNEKNDEDDEGFENCTKYWICDNGHVDADFKVRDHCHNTEKYGGSAHRCCNINVKLNCEILILFHNLKDYDLYFII